MCNARVWRGLWRTAATIGIAAAAVGAGIGLSGSVAGATPTPTTKAAKWLQGQLTTGNHYKTTFTSGKFAPGLTADGLFAFAAAGSTFAHDVTAVATWLDNVTHIGTYIGSSQDYPGALVKVALAAEVAKVKGFTYTPTTFAGTNLITDLEGTQVLSGTKKGDFTDPRDTPTYLGYANPTSQALAIIVLEKVAPSFSGLGTAATYLEGQVCTTSNGGGFHGYPSIYGGCATNTIGGDVDTTGAVSQALSYYAAQTGDATAKTAAEKANNWLDHEKAAAGSTKLTWKNFCQAPYTSLTPSVNSTAMAIEGLVDDPRPGHFATDVANGKNWLVAAQNATASSPTDGSLPACTASGPGNVRATTQGTQGLAEKSWVDLL